MGATGVKLNGRKVDRQFFEREFSGITIHDFHKGPEGVYYLVAERKSHPGERFAVVVPTEMHGGWFYYREYSEFEGPYYHGCPVRLLDQLTPTDNAEATKWRRLCRA